MRSTADGTAMRALARMAGRRFNSFAEAADLALELLADALPNGRTVIAQIDREDGLYRVIDARGMASRVWTPRPRSA